MFVGALYCSRASPRNFRSGGHLTQARRMFLPSRFYFNLPLKLANSSSLVLQVSLLAAVWMLLAAFKRTEPVASCLSSSSLGAVCLAVGGPVFKFAVCTCVQSLLTQAGKTSYSAC